MEDEMAAFEKRMIHGAEKLKWARVFPAVTCKDPWAIIMMPEAMRRDHLEGLRDFVQYGKTGKFNPENIGIITDNLGRRPETWEEYTIGLWGLRKDKSHISPTLRPGTALGAQEFEKYLHEAGISTADAARYLDVDPTEKRDIVLVDRCLSRQDHLFILTHELEHVRDHKGEISYPVNRHDKEMQENRAAYEILTDLRAWIQTMPLIGKNHSQQSYIKISTDAPKEVLDLIVYANTLSNCGMRMLKELEHSMGDERIVNYLSESYIWPIETSQMGKNRALSQVAGALLQAERKYVRPTLTQLALAA